MIGIDIVLLSHFDHVINSPGGNTFIKRVFSESELAQCENKSDKMKSLAGRYAIKEAVIKASKGELNISDLKAIQIRQDISGYLDVVVDRNDISCCKYDVSMSHDGDYIVGIAVKFKFD